MQRGGAVAVQGAEAHQIRIGWFVERVVAQQRAGEGDCLRVVPARFVQGDQLPQGARVLLGQPFPFHQQPIAVAARQQLAAVEGRRLPQMLCALDGIGRPIGPRQRLLKGDHVHLATGVSAPLHRQVIG